MKRINLLLGALFLVSAISSCKKNIQEDVPSTGDPNHGILKGITYSPNWNVAMGAVIVEAIVNGIKIADTTDKDGKFALEIPAGEHLVKMYTGAGDRFITRKIFTIQAGKTTEVSAAQSRLGFTGKIAYLAGDFDAIQEIVTELGIPVTSLTLDDMQNYHILNQYDVLLLNCNSGYDEFEEIKPLERFLKDGKSIYASDFEMRALSKQEWGFIPENLISYERDGIAGTIQGQILFEPFKKALGSNTMTIAFDLPGFVRITSLNTTDPSVKVLVDHPQKGPLALNIQWAPGRVSSQGIAYGGNIIYTTFHDASLSNDVKTVLRQMIMQL